MAKPTASGLVDKEIEKVEKQLEAFESNVKDMTLDRMNAAPKQEVAPQTELSQQQIEKSKDIYLKPKRSIACREKFNENYREKYNYDKEYVHFIAENKEIIGETIDIWTRPYAGMPAEEWDVPTNKPVWGPRYLAEQIKRKKYHRLVMRDQSTNAEGGMQFYGTMAVDSSIQRLDANAVSTRKQFSMRSSGAF